MTRIKNFNIVKLDSKGRLLVPFHIRELMNLEEGSEFIIINNEKNELKVFPLIKDRTIEINMKIDDSPGTLAQITSILAKKSMNIIMSQSRTLERGKSAEWDAIVDISECKNFEKDIEDISRNRIIKKINLVNES